VVDVTFFSIKTSILLEKDIAVFSLEDACGRVLFPHGIKGSVSRYFSLPLFLIADIPLLIEFRLPADHIADLPIYTAIELPVSAFTQHKSLATAWARRNLAMSSKQYIFSDGA
jgi:hypothetical protein